ncbi:FAD-linked oxidoreductase-like protein [Crassisporium funariophilum]|nr:FAD-linked oxidoreductase-like protein [Crassisporium funariophilum]
MFRVHLHRSVNSFRTQYNLQFRSRSISNAAFLTRRTAARATGGVLAASSLLLASTVYADSDSEAKKLSSLGSYVRAYTVYSMCAVPALVDASPRILSVLTAVPGLKQLTEAFVRVTFFDQFVGADSAAEALPLLQSLRSENKGVLFAYSVEVDENEATADDSVSQSHPHKRIVDEMLHCIDVAADFEAGLAAKQTSLSTSALGPGGRRTWVAVKMTALLPDAHALIALSSHIVNSRKHTQSVKSANDMSAIPFPGSARIEDLDIVLKAPAAETLLTPEQITDLRGLHGDLLRICTRAKEKGVKVIVDAEYSWYQPAIDAMTLALMRDFNSIDPKAARGEVQPLVYGTFQAYLRRTPAQLNLALADARTNNYALGVKLVRGAYHPHELAAHQAAIAFNQALAAAVHSPLEASRGSHPGLAHRPSLSISPDEEPPVWTEKWQTDEAYDSCVKVLVKAVAEDVRRCGTGGNVSLVEGAVREEKKGWFRGIFSRGVDSDNGKGRLVSDGKRMAPAIGVLFGTHNWNSCSLILKELVHNGLAFRIEEDASANVIVGEEGGRQGAIRIGEETVERVAIGQLYGMCDDLTEWVVERAVSTTPFVIKYVPYGALSEVLPYLSRRAIENKSVLGDGAAARERQRARKEIWKRIIG